MKNYVIVAVIAFAGIGSAWFVLNNDSAPAPIEPDIVATESEESDMDTEMNVSPVTADPVATINDAEISNADFTAQQEQVLSSQGINSTSLDGETQNIIQNQVLNSLISQELLKQAAEAEGVTVSEEEIDTQLDTIKSQFADEATYEQALATQGLTETELRDQLTAELSVEQYLEATLDLSSITVSEEEVTAVYEEAAAQQELPPFEEVRGEVEQLALQQKRQPVINQHIEALQEVADIEIFI